MSEVERAEELMQKYAELAYEVACLVQDQYDEQENPEQFLFWHRIKIYIGARS
jgi:hypothetical protein